MKIDKLKKTSKQIFAYGKKHKTLSIIVLIVVIYTGWSIVKNISTANAETRYILGTVEKGSVISSLSVSGQVSASNELEVKPKASGEVTYVGVKPGDFVKAGTLLAKLDTKTAEKSVRDAEANLESAKLSLEKLKKPADALTLLQSENSLSNAKDSLENSYANGHTDVINVFLDLPSVINGLEEILLGDFTGRNIRWNINFYQSTINEYDERGTIFRNVAYEDFLKAKESYNQAFSLYQSLKDNPDNDAIENAIDTSSEAVKDAAKAVKSANALIQLYVDLYEARNIKPESEAYTHLASLNSFTSDLNSHSSKLLSDVSSIKQYKQSVAEKELSLEDTRNGADPLDLRSAELSVEKAENSLTDAKNNLADYYVRAPFDGLIASLGVKKYDTAGSGTILATLITNQKIAELSLNEVDVSKIKLGNKATLTFDAIDDLSLTGEVSEIDTIGTVSQGVVSYSLKVVFDSQDDRVKSGMTVNASIITDAKHDVLIVPLSAIKSQGENQYVEVFEGASYSEEESSSGIVSNVAPSRISVVTGISDDSSSEIVSGVTEGQQIVIRSISSQSSTSQTQSNAPSLFGSGSRTTGGASIRTFNAGR